MIVRLGGCHWEVYRNKETLVLYIHIVGIEGSVSMSQPGVGVVPTLT